MMDAVVVIKYYSNDWWYSGDEGRGACAYGGGGDVCLGGDIVQ